MYHSSMSALQADKANARKKIIPSSKKKGLREEFKKTFLPLLIDVFELRQMIRHHKTQNPNVDTKEYKSPKDILEKLQQLQSNIEESKRWCDGIISQISKGIDEAKEALQCIENPVTMDSLSRKSAQKERGSNTNYSQKIKRFFLFFWNKICHQ